MAHQGLKQHIDLNISRLATHKALRDEIINNRRQQRSGTARQRWRRTARQRQRRQRQGKGKGKDEKPAGKFEAKCRYCQKKGHKKAEWRKMKVDLAASKVTTMASQQVSTRSQRLARRTQPSPQACYAPSLASTIPMQQMVPVNFQSPVGSQAPQQTETGSST